MNARRREQAATWLREALSNGEIGAGTITKRTAALGINFRTVQRAATDLGIVSRKVKGEWLWSLPSAPTVTQGDKATTEAPSESLAEERSRMIAELRAQFWSQVQAEVSERRARLDAREKELDDLQLRLHARSASVVELLSYDEFRLVRSCLHPDRAPSDRVESFTKAFQIVQRFEATADPSLPIAFLRECGWDHLRRHRRR